jgi:hypothetical protein
MTRDELIEQAAKVSWESSGGYITSIPWPPSAGFHAEKERRRARGLADAGMLVDPGQAERLQSLLAETVRAAVGCPCGGGERQGHNCVNRYHGESAHWIRSLRDVLGLPTPRSARRERDTP